MPKRGRPVLGDKGKIKAFRVAVTTEEHEWFMKLAKEQNTTVSKLFRNSVQILYGGEMNMTLFAVIAEGYYEQYGSRKYCIGIYDTRELAEKAANEYYELVKHEADEHPEEEPIYDDDYDYYFYHDDEYSELRYIVADDNRENLVKIMEFNLNETYEMAQSSRCYTEFVNDKYLGGYAE